MGEPTMFAVGFACGVMAAVVALLLLLCTLKGNGGGRRNPSAPANYRRPPPPPAPPAPNHFGSVEDCAHRFNGKDNSRLHFGGFPPAGKIAPPPKRR